jgi:hypothetical protein
MLKVRMARVQHTEVPQSAGQRGQVFPIPVEIGVGVDCVEWHQQRVLQVFTEEREVRDVYDQKVRPQISVAIR